MAMSDIGDRVLIARESVVHRLSARCDASPMTTRPPNLAQAPWLEGELAGRVFAALAAEGDEARIVGGAVRNALNGVPVADVDFATTATPEAVARLAAAAHIKTVPTGV